MNRIDQKFAELKKQKRTAFMPFALAGDPNFKGSLKTLRQLAKYADMIEVGFPYSDPLADGPTIQAADNRALASKMTTEKVFKLVKEFRKESAIPVSVLAYANLVYQQGINNFYKKAQACGIDAVLVPDLPVEEAEEYAQAAISHSVLPIFLVAETTTNERLLKILKLAKGYLYIVSLLGVTGKRKNLNTSVLKRIKELKKKTKLPLAVGFGISTPEQVLKLKEAGADGVIVASALIDAAQKGRLNTLLKQLCAPLK